MQLLVPPPANEQELMHRASRLAGLTIGQVASALNFQVPEKLTREKGWQGQFIEACLGADSGSLSQPDFNHLGIELKTLPIDHRGRVLESTYVCVLSLTGQNLLSWEDSPVYKKLNKVLWVPIARCPEDSVIDYRIATPFLWQASPDDLAVIKNDWEEAMDKVQLGRIDSLNAKYGEYLQVRPKAANSRVLTEATNSRGETIETLPRGFYLRPKFTQRLLETYLKIR
ncbi:DNA mismatch repair endonuclease MutH [Aliikangiella sp. G2MR2-5]|uniref:DNA mismatch repair endonuclease MutH n=1 Tax=Aliikangiella sp. G2MR2-5 TaxID=2788943 RepID=UPI001AED8996|nr:DNA mismatch repair endonuclease MutH [Aliikangiella sp. G2MR2-5]